MEQAPSQALSDALCKVAQSRDKRAFATLFEYFAPKIKRFGIKQFGNEALAMELVQDTLTSVWRKAHLYHPDKGAATTWVYTVMRNASFDALRKMKSNKEEHLSEEIWPLLQDEQVIDDGFADHLQDNKIKEHISKLPPAQQDVVKGVYFQQMSQEQLAEQLDIPVGTVKSRLRLALQKLRAEMGDSND
ncbi:sigma-70 family RNA polymerase sigma factor [Pseudoalteromonas sp. S16_S37]|uniref:sigma-70 family RNA polymerase sigma factor n=1 Tax=Pseudoalteromonas sp. S16_S37 TaxID=2720228 RepID=UPI001EEEA465|nr:sigma-70 family RNA polymerase sigma factor [Pseudoalteromonas sp. S16_S37]